jgi:hypothetical protein
MIRFRVGQSWRREPEPGGEPRDSFSLELDGVNLLPGAADEPLVPVVASLVRAVAALASGAERSAQLSLEDVAIEVCFWRRAGLEVEVTVVSVGPEARALRPLVVVELPALVEAAATCARAFLRDLGTEGAASGAPAIERQLRWLQGTVLAPLDPPPAEGWSLGRSVEGLGYILEDRDGRTISYGRRSPGGLPPLLVAGAVSLPGGAAVAGLPFLTLMGLARAAGEDGARLAGQKVPARAVYQASLDVCLALRTRNPALATNPWLEALQARCTAGLAALREPVPDHRAPGVVTPLRAATMTPLSPRGQVRRLTLQARWSRTLDLGEEPGALQLDRGAVVVSSAHGAQSFTRTGDPLHLRTGTRGVACRGLASLCAGPERLAYYPGAGASAAWLRDHDGTPVGPALELVDGVLITPLAGRGAGAYQPLTGREAWRFDPSRTQRAWLSTTGDRVLVATDGGTLYGLDARTGQLRFSARAERPCHGPAVQSGRRAVTLHRRGGHTTVSLCEVLAGEGTDHAGAVAWTRELSLGAQGPPVVSRGRVYVAGDRDGRAVVVALSSRGEVLWERSTPLDATSQLALPFQRGLLLSDGRGAAVRLLPGGETAWALEGSTDQLSAAVRPVLRRGVLVVPGPAVRLVDPAVGRLLAQVETGPRVLDVAVDTRLTLYALREHGVLEAFEPRAVLALVT